MPSHYDWPKVVWQNPLPHDFTFSFGLDMDDAAATKNSTIIPFVMQDNAIIDYETIKTNKENADFAVVAKPNCAAGSYVPKCSVSWVGFSPAAEVNIMKFKYMDIHTAMLNRLDAFDKKTGNDIETILELTHEVTDEQTIPLWNTVKIYEGHHVQDLPAEVPGLSTNQQPEGVAFDLEMYFDALHYYTNRQMLRTLTGRMLNYELSRPVVDNIRTDARVAKYFNTRMPKIASYMNPYAFYGGLFHCPQVGTQNQYMTTTTAIEHLTILGRCRFNEYNPDFNFARA